MLKAEIFYSKNPDDDVGDRVSLKEHVQLAREWLKQSLIMTDEEKSQNERAMKAFRESISKSLTHPPKKKLFYPAPRCPASADQLPMIIRAIGQCHGRRVDG